MLQGEQTGTRRRQGVGRAAARRRKHQMTMYARGKDTGRRGGRAPLGCGGEEAPSVASMGGACLRRAPARQGRTARRQRGLGTQGHQTVPEVEARRHSNMGAKISTQGSACPGDRRARRTGDQAPRAPAVLLQYNNQLCMGCLATVRVGGLRWCWVGRGWYSSACRCCNA